MNDPTAAASEIERKNLVRERPPDLGRCPHDRIRQGYLAVAEDGTEARVRDDSGAAGR